MTRHPSKPESDANGKCIAALDWRGNRFAVGDKVLYCISAGRSQLMAVGIVVQIKAAVAYRNVHQPCDADDPEAETGRDGSCYRRISVPYDEVTVQVRTLKTSGRWDNTERSKPAWVNPANITAITPVGEP